MHYTVEFKGKRGNLYTQLYAGYTFEDTTLPRTVTLTLSPNAVISIDLIDITLLQLVGLSCETGSVNLSVINNGSTIINLPKVVAGSYHFNNVDIVDARIELVAVGTAPVPLQLVYAGIA
jgi:hypothetical protein